MRTRTAGWTAAAATALTLAGGLVSPAHAASVTQQDAAFLKAAHQSNLAEIAAGLDAQVHARSSCVKKVGAHFVADHRKLDASVRDLARRLGVTLPTAPNAQQRSAAAQAKAQVGKAAYDSTWLSTEAAGHQTTLNAIDRELRAGSNSQVVALARTARPVVAGHLRLVSGGTCRTPATSG
ncbi:DUF4142 domain-containing protein [Streptomyces sp. NPDC059740]|uniref:DUF4142 domain-containing protein n=1 Tax=Streptomyces sp. NPDC059740 TaxID=3346926 RepID=UPI0036507400